MSYFAGLNLMKSPKKRALLCTTQYHDVLQMCLTLHHVISRWIENVPYFAPLYHY